MSTGIPYCDETWELVGGCTPCSPGCDHCWAQRVTARLASHLRGRRYDGLVDADGKWTGTVRCVPERLAQPLSWKRPRVIFCTSRGDLFHPEVPDSFIYAALSIMAATPRHTYLLVTKRAARMAEIAQRIAASAPHDEVNIQVFDLVNAMNGDFAQWPLPNVWALPTCCTQAEVDEKLRAVLASPWAHVGVSLEPLLEYVILPAGLEWVIAGCESGPGRRRAERFWFNGLVLQCQGRMPLFLKQIQIDGKVDTRPTLAGQAWRQRPW